MSQAQAAAGPDRLPWLEDEPKVRIRRSRRLRDIAVWAVAALLLVAGVSYWIISSSSQRAPQHHQAKQPATTVVLPQPRPTEPPQPQVVFQPAPQVSPSPQREVAISKPRVEKRPVARSDGEASASSAPPAEEKPVSSPAAAEAGSAQPTPAPAPAYKPLKPWPAWQSEGSSGRIVRIGAFGTREQAKLGWRYMVQAYPAVAHLKATVVGDRNSRGRHFYRFQIGTTSQAHSEVLCQRMEKIHLSCAVVGLPWSPKGVER